MGHHFPLNPPDPLRTVLRNKVEELVPQDKHLENYLRILQGEWKEIILPPGAMH